MSKKQAPQPLLDLERSAYLAERAYIIPLTFGRARVVVDAIPGLLYEDEFW